MFSQSDERGTCPNTFERDVTFNVLFGGSIYTVKEHVTLKCKPPCLTWIGSRNVTLPPTNMELDNPLFVEAIVYFHDCWREGIFQGVTIW